MIARSKTCFKCGEVKLLSLFYKHKGMSDGHLNKCIECAKKDMNANREDKLEYYRASDMARGSRKTQEHTYLYRANNPEKYKAHGIVGRAIRAGKLLHQPCEVCSNLEGNHAHHDDYSKPLEVRWLCPACHSEWHKAKAI